MTTEHTRPLPAWPGQRIAADPMRQQPGAYLVRVHHPVRWSDLQEGRLSRVAMAQLFEDARVHVMSTLLGARFTAPGAWNAVARAITIEYLQPGDESESVELVGCIDRLGTSSYTFALAVFQAGRCLALCRAVGVSVDQSMKPAPIPQAIRQAIGTSVWSGLALPQTQPAGLPDTPQAYPFSMELPTRFSDTDAVGHVNNVAVFRYHDNGYMAFQRVCLGARIPAGQAGSWRVTRQEALMQAETFYPGPVALGVAVEQVAADHFVLLHGLFQRGRCTGHLRTTVMVPDAQGRACPLAAALRQHLDDWVLRPASVPA